MCLRFEEFSSSTSFPEVFATQTKNVMNHLLQLPAQIFALGKSLVTDLTKLARSSNGLEVALWCAEDTIQVLDLAQRAEAISRPIFAACAHVVSFIGAGRIFSSLNYIFKGTFYKDVIEGNVLSLASALAFFARRIVVTTAWMAKYNLVDMNTHLERLSQVADTVGITPVLQYVPRVSQQQFLDGSLAAAMLPIAIQHGQKVAEGEDPVYNFLECASATATVVGATLRLAGVDNPYVLGGFSFVAATTGLLAFFSDSSNVQTKNPFINL